MTYNGRTTTTITAPANAPMDLNSAGRPDWRELAPTIVLTLALLIPAAGGGALIVGNWPHEGSSGWSALWLSLGIALTVGSGRFFWTLSHELMRSVKAYNDRVEMWHDAVLDKYIAGNGEVVAHQVSEWSYTETDMRHILTLVAWLIVQRTTRCGYRDFRGV